MKVTLYKNCKLNNKYKDVFYNKTYLETYLGTLTSVVPLNDRDIFSREADTLFIDDANITDFKQYNYMKIEDTIGTFYAFINNIKWINEIYQIFYEEDVMSNYFEYVHIRNSLLTGNKSLYLYKGTAKKQIKLFNYPVLPQSNENLIVTGYNITDNQVGTSYEPKISLVVKMQLYKLTQAGEPNERIPLIGVIGRAPISGTGSTVYDLYSNSVSSALNDFIEKFINNKSTTQISYFGDNYYYDIDKIYAVPSDYIITNNVIAGYYQSVDLFNIDAYDKYIFVEIRGVNYNGIENTYTKTITYDRTIDSVGLFTQQVPIINNGTNITVTITTYIKYYGISFIMSVQNKMIDITSNFIVELPYTQVSSSELQLKRMQYQSQKYDEEQKIDRIKINTDYNKIGFVTDLGGMGLSTVGAIAGSSIAGSAISGDSGLLSGISSVYKRAERQEENNLDIKYANYRLNLLNRKMYSTTAIANNNFTYINALFGLCVFKINEDNTTQVNQSVALSGYIVRELVNDIIQQLDIENLTDHYDVFKFDEVNLYGVIAQDYIRIIEGILLNGVRVWCQGAIGELI